ncbi:MAG TPA: hypothetical protein VK689_08020, partial [Armatimonadota bacterium]|nr:hypothetical protein [Armatimonadota bacterium]
MKHTHAAIPALAAGLLLMGALAGSAGENLRARRFKFTYKTTVRDIPEGAQSLKVWLPYPQTDVNQTIHQVKIDAPGAVTLAREPRMGNQVVFFQAEAPKGPVQITMEVVATRRENAGLREALSAADARPYLIAEPLVPVDGPVKAVADAAVKGKKGDA